MTILHANGVARRSARQARYTSSPLKEAPQIGSDAPPTSAASLHGLPSSAAPAPPMAVPLSPPVDAISETPAELAGWRIYQGAWLRNHRFGFADQHGEGQ